MGNIYGHARVSTKEQNLNRQFDALGVAGVSKSMIFADKVSRKDFARPEYRRLKDKLHEGDALVIKSIDRLGRNYSEILEEWRGCITLIRVTNFRISQIFSPSTY